METDNIYDSNTAKTEPDSNVAAVSRMLPAYQLISKVLNTKDMYIIEKFGLDSSYIHDPYCCGIYEKIKAHFDKYGNVPDTETMLSLGSDCADFVNNYHMNVTESDKYIMDRIWEDHIFHLSANVIQQAAKITEEDSIEGVRYLQSQLGELTKTLRPEGVDIISQAAKRLDTYKAKQECSNWYYPTGFPELDKVLEGWSPGEELVVLFARTGVGKTWILTKILTEAWRNLFNVGLIEPEMTDDKIGYRFDTLYKHYSNRELSYGKELSSGPTDYDRYISDLPRSTTKFMVAHPKDFGGVITVSKLKTWCRANNIKILGIDGISYIKDERARSGDSMTIALTNISADLMDLSIELGIPVLIVVQSNREGIAQGGKLDLSNIRDSDGIAYSASTVIGLYKKSNALHMQILKNRNGENDITLVYDWDINIGTFQFIQEGELENDDDEASDNRATHSYTPNNSPSRPSRAPSYDTGPAYAMTPEDQF